MNTQQLEFKTAGHGTSQNERVLALLQERAGRWVPMWELEHFSGSHRMNSRVAELRKRGWTIENRTEKHDGAVHSFYRLVKSEPPTNQTKE